MQYVIKNGEKKKKNMVLYPITLISVSDLSVFDVGQVCFFIKQIPV